jgi:hypothetical protein
MVLRVSMVLVKSGDQQMVRSWVTWSGVAREFSSPRGQTLTTKCRVILVPAPNLVISRLVALNSRVLHLALTQAARGCARGQGNSPSVVTSGWSGPRGLANIPKLP